MKTKLLLAVTATLVVVALAPGRAGAWQQNLNQQYSNYAPQPGTPSGPNQCVIGEKLQTSDQTARITGQTSSGPYGLSNCKTVCVTGVFNVFGTLTDGTTNCRSWWDAPPSGYPCCFELYQASSSGLGFPVFGAKYLIQKLDGSFVASTSSVFG